MDDLAAPGPSRQYALPASGAGSIAAAGKLFIQNGAPFYLRGVTYGTFAPDANGDQYPSRAQAADDFKAIAASGFNTVRTYTPPPPWLLDAAAENGLRILAGLAWEQHITFLDDAARARDIRARVRKQAEACAGHPGLFGFSIGNEIPAPIVRWHGRERIQDFLRDLYDTTKSACPGALTTYVNFPTTAYLELPFLDFSSFNVYLEERAEFSAYLKRLHNISSDLPLVMTEIGLDSRRNGEEKQAVSLDWQIRTAFDEGCARAFVYAWTDEWYRGGNPILEWDFGLTTRSREPKKALATVSAAMTEMPFGEPRKWPSVSVVVCSYNGSATIRDTLDSLARLDYPDYEVIVINDGSKDKTPEIAAEYNVRLISTENQGLGKARNEGLAIARGEIVVYTDDDAYPPPPWLRYLARAFMESNHDCIGGPNLVPPEDGWTGQCVADSPGGPLPVLLTDDIAEHVPGCNMAFRRERLAAIGGFDPLYRAAGDDVDVCWRLLDGGGTIGYMAAAMVWHHRRATVKGYWRQQIGYGEAEALLEQKWPGRFSALGHLSWSGQIYGRGLALPFLTPNPRVYQGQWGLAPYQGLYQSTPFTALSIAQTPEWLLPIYFLTVISLLGFVYAPLGWAIVLAASMFAVSLVQAFRGATNAKHIMRARNRSSRERMRSFSLIFLLHLLQPAGRLWGRLKLGLTPWRLKKRRPSFVGSSVKAIWSETWRPADDWLRIIEKNLVFQGAIVNRGSDFDDWDLRVPGGIFASGYLSMTIEEHKDGKQNLRFRRSFSLSRLSLISGASAPLIVIVGLCVASPALALMASAFLAWIAWQTMSDCSAAVSQIDAALPLATDSTPYGAAVLSENDS